MSQGKETNTDDREGGVKTWNRAQTTKREEPRHGNKHKRQRGRSQDMETNIKDKEVGIKTTNLQR